MNGATDQLVIRVEKSLAIVLLEQRVKEKQEHIDALQRENARLKAELDQARATTAPQALIDNIARLLREHGYSAADGITLSIERALKSRQLLQSEAAALAKKLDDAKTHIRQQAHQLADATNKLANIHVMSR